ncbi:hypothetical protein AB0K49_27975 [Streptomyces decoyicus]|uniref:hypothetical protein n=1 Tax=Streptomyces decoyicus TaxID=249567 RepID=UPI00345C9132
MSADPAVLTALVAGGHHEELALHVRAALRNGLAPDGPASADMACAAFLCRGGAPRYGRTYVISRRPDAASHRQRRDPRPGAEYPSRATPDHP